MNEKGRKQGVRKEETGRREEDSKDERKQGEER